MNFFDNRSWPAKTNAGQVPYFTYQLSYLIEKTITPREGEAKATPPHRGMGESTTIQRESDESDTQDFILF